MNLLHFSHRKLLLHLHRGRSHLIPILWMNKKQLMSHIHCTITHQVEWFDWNLRHQMSLQPQQRRLRESPSFCKWHLPLVCQSHHRKQSPIHHYKRLPHDLLYYSIHSLIELQQLWCKKRTFILSYFKTKQTSSILEESQPATQCDEVSPEPEFYFDILQRKRCIKSKWFKFG